LSVHPIEAQSYRILAARVDLGHLAPGPRTVVERIIHASADLSYATSVIVDEAAVTAGIGALRSGAPVVVDTEMVRAGISAHPTTCMLSEVRAGASGYPTRSAMAMRLAAERHPEGAIWVVGNAPTALAELVGLARAGRLRPALIIGLPVGFVGAAESKQALRDLAADVGTANITNVGEKGGSAVAAAAFNAIARLAEAEAALSASRTGGAGGPGGPGAQQGAR